MKRFTPDQIVSKLHQADVELGKGLTVPEPATLTLLALGCLALIRKRK